MNERQQTSGNLALAQKKVIVIEAAQRPEAQKLRVAAYCRVSSDSSDQLNSFMAQLNRYTTLIGSKENWTLVDLYADEGISGTSAKKRPEFLKMIRKCRQKKIDLVLVKSISRFARNTVDCLNYMREGKVHYQYRWLYAYEKGKDGKPKIVPEQAEVVKRIYDSYLHEPERNADRSDHQRHANGIGACSRRDDEHSGY